MDDFDARRASLDLVTVFVNNNSLSAGELPGLLRDVFDAISGFAATASSVTQPGNGASAAQATKPIPSPAGELIEPTSTGEECIAPTTAATAPVASTPAVSVGQSLADPAVIVSLITGESFKTLKRHLTKHGLTEAEYKARFNLPHDYPMVAPAYAEVRRRIAAARHTKGKLVGAVAAFAATPAVEAEQPAAKSPTAKPVLRSAKGAGKFAAAAKAERQRGQRRFSGEPVKRVTAANRPSDASKRPADDQVAADSRPDPVAQPRTAPSKQPAIKASPAKSPQKRRMARPPATDSNSEAGKSAAAPERKVAGANLTSPTQIPARTSKSAGGAPSAGNESVQPDSSRKGRKKLSVKFG